MWIDAICINQGDLDERSGEVEKVGLIYNNARPVIVWLSPSTENSALAMETWGNIGQEVTYFEEKNDVRYKPGGWAEYLMRNTNALRSNMDSWSAAGGLLRREWFSRLWVLQEIGLATDAVVIVGKFGLNWDVFRLELSGVCILKSYQGFWASMPSRLVRFLSS
jgi:hypothetical protein